MMNEPMASANHCAARAAFTVAGLGIPAAASCHVTDSDDAMQCTVH